MGRLRRLQHGVHRHEHATRSRSAESGDDLLHLLGQPQRNAFAKLQPEGNQATRESFYAPGQHAVGKRPPRRHHRHTLRVAVRRG